MLTVYTFLQLEQALLETQSQMQAASLQEVRAQMVFIFAPALAVLQL